MARSVLVVEHLLTENRSVRPVELFDQDNLLEMLDQELKILQELDRSDNVRPVVLFDYDKVREALDQEVKRLYELELPRNRPFDERVFNLVMDLVTFSFLPRWPWPSPQEAARIRYREEMERQEKRMCPTSLLTWIDHQTDDRIVIKSHDWMLDWMWYRTIPGPPSIRLGDREESGTLDFIEAHCEECCMTYSPEELEMQYWSYDKGALAAAYGRSLVCPRRHVLLKVTELQS